MAWVGVYQKKDGRLPALLLVWNWLFHKKKIKKIEFFFQKYLKSRVSYQKKGRRGHIRDLSVWCSPCMKYLYAWNTCVLEIRAFVLEQFRLSLDVHAAFLCPNMLSASEIIA